MIIFEAGRVQDRTGPFRGFVTPMSNTHLPFSPGTQVLEPPRNFYPQQRL
ncbi:hypothetical protein ALO75_102085 [Pseudomonas syringae pv. coryli]|uniref:Uncharacterized protein n=1 Tax=Pseudomonas syringae pv. coryli TaxID=317659 RepID=A0A0P9PSV7_9PSED|nr:hypothetical protein ALO75_102085 [Pseudomonas syringae pv. coryli]